MDYMYQQIVDVTTDVIGWREQCGEAESTTEQLHKDKHNLEMRLEQAREQLERAGQCSP